MDTTRRYCPRILWTGLFRIKSIVTRTLFSAGEMLKTLFDTLLSFNFCDQRAINCLLNNLTVQIFIKFQLLPRQAFLWDCCINIKKQDTTALKWVLTLNRYNRISGSIDSSNCWRQGQPVWVRVHVQSFLPNKENRDRWLLLCLQNWIPFS